MKLNEDTEGRGGHAGRGQTGRDAKGMRLLVTLPIQTAACKTFAFPS